MLLTLLLMVQTSTPDSSKSYSGRSDQITVPIPRIEAEVTVDGQLDEPAWQTAARLTGFSQYAPSDGVAAQDSTEVLVWYAPGAILFGIRAYEAHGPVHATLADRDRIFSDDNIQILLGTFRDGRQASFFAVNPLGVQADGALVEGVGGGTANGIGTTTGAREAPDLSPDLVFQSRGHITPWGYEVEIRIPFKSLRYQPTRVQDWSLNVVRQVKHSGVEDTWAPTRRAAASFLGQSGTLVGLTDLHRGLVMDLNPELTNKVNGAPAPGGYKYDADSPQLGGNLRWGLSSNLTLNGTANPDFSQVESDAGQLAFDPRNALFFPEKRPFFLDGIEQFQTPNLLIYTRRIVQPVGAVKLTGKSLGTNLGVMAAVDDKDASRSGQDNPTFVILRAQRDMGRQSRLGIALTDRREPSTTNQVADLDGRLVFGDIYSLQFQGAASRTEEGGTTRTAPLWRAQFDINGQTLGLSAGSTGISDQFRADAGFIQRTGVVQNFIDPRITLYGRPGALVQRVNVDLFLTANWQYQAFVRGDGVQDKKVHLNAGATLRGGWNLVLGLFVERFGYDASIYRNYALEVAAPGGGLDTIPFTGQPTINNAEVIWQVTTPQWKQFDAFLFGLRGHDENFFEWASGDLSVLNAGFNWRPTARARIGVTYNWQQVDRRTDGSTVFVGRIPRLKLEYQLTRPVFIRLVGQYVEQKTDALRDDSRTGAPILIGGIRTTAQQHNQFLVDALFSYQPTPGTVLFAGYGATMQEPDAFRFGELRRTQDGFFAKLSYLFRL